MRVERPYRVVIVSLDRHAEGPVARAERALAQRFPGISVTVHAATEWTASPAACQEAQAAVATADIVIVTVLFLDEHLRAILPALEARRADCDAMVGMISAPEVVTLTRMGGLDMRQPSGALSLLRRMRGSKGPASSGKRQLAMLRRLPALLRYVPGKAQDLRAWMLSMQYWLGGSDDNLESLVRLLVSRYARREAWRGGDVPPPVRHPDVGLYHPRLDGRITQDRGRLPVPAERTATVGLLIMRSYVLAGDTAHYDAVIAAFEARGIAVVPAFASGLDSRPAIDAFFRGPDGASVDALVSLSGFSLVGGPAYNDSDGAQAALAALDVPYIAAHPLEFQTLGQWAGNPAGLGPVEATMLVALPEIDGATNPIVFGGRHGPEGCSGCARRCQGSLGQRDMAPCHERIEVLAARVARLVRLRRLPARERRVAIVIYGFPPNAGSVGTAAHLGVFESLANVLASLRADGYDVEVPPSVDALREALLCGNAERLGQQANVAALVPADRIVAGETHLREIEAQWGPAPGRHQTDGRGVFVLGAHFGKVFVGVQPAFGYEGDPMRLLFERGFAPTHAFAAFYRWLKEDFGADALLHFGMHGALEFMPGKQAGPGAGCWPDRLIGDLPHVYLYAANNPSEATLAKRRAAATLVSHLTPPLARAGLYKGLAELKDSLSTWRALPEESPDREELLSLIKLQAEAVDLPATSPDRLWLTLLETESALIPEGLHVVGKRLSDIDIARQIEAMPPDPEARETARRLLGTDHETAGLLHALAGGFTPPVPGGDLIRNPGVLPTGRNVHAFDPFRMPTAFALQDGARQAARLLAAHPTPPRSVALVLWGSDSIKTDGGPIAQALALLGARPRFDGYGRLAGAELVPLAEHGRPRIDVLITLSGIFRDLLPLQTRLLAEAAWLAATADEPEEQNYVRAHALAYAARTGCDLETASLRVFSNAEGAYGANVNQLVDSGAWEAGDDLADAYQARKSFAYGRDGRSVRQPELLASALADIELAYQNLESVELGVTTVDHYFDTLGGISRAVARARGSAPAIYVSDQTRGEGKVRTLADQVSLETRTRSLNPKWFEALLSHGHEGVRHIEAQVTNTLGWSATTGQVEPWVYQRLSETFVLDEAMRRRLATLNPPASARMANRLIEAHDRAYWHPDEATLEALRRGAEELEDRLEGIPFAAE